MAEETPKDYPFDAVDFGLMLTTAMVPPHWPWALRLGVSTIVRRSPKAAAYILEALKLDAPTVPKWLLPGAVGLPAKEKEEKATPEQPVKPQATKPTGPVAAQGQGEGLDAALARLPERVDLLKLALHASPTAIPLGVGPDQQPVWADIATDALHIGLYGQSGAGKDNLLRCWFVTLARRNRPDAVQFAFLDGKGDWLIPQLANLGHMFIAPAGGYGKPGDDEILAAVKQIDAEAQRRQAAIQAVGCISRDAYLAKTGQPMPLLVVIATDVMTSVAGEVEKLLVNLVSKARSLGIRVVVSMQTPTRQDTRWRGNLSTVLAGALQSGSQDEPALGIAVKDLHYRPSQLPPPLQQPGIFVARTGGRQVLVRAPWLNSAAFEAQRAKLPSVKSFGGSDADLLASLLAGNELPDAGNAVAPRSPRVSACRSEVTALPESELPAPTGAEIALITRMLVTGMTRTQITKQLPGYTPKFYKRFKAKVDYVADLLEDDVTRPKIVRWMFEPVLRLRAEEPQHADAATEIRPPLDVDSAC